jgi:hypothetical protein
LVQARHGAAVRAELPAKIEFRTAKVWKTGPPEQIRTPL